MMTTGRGSAAAVRPSAPSSTASTLNVYGAVGSTPGGVFAGSTDYWPEKIDTAGMKVLGMDWRISRRDRRFIDAPPIRPFIGDIEWSPGARHRLRKPSASFGWFALRKRLMTRVKPRSAT